MIINKAIVSTDHNALYYEFWPIVARGWSNFKIEPVVAAIGNIHLNYAHGIVIKFPVIDGVPSGFIAQVIRFIIPCLYPDEVSIIGDIDMLPLNKFYFTKSISQYPDDSIIIFSSDAYKTELRYPMCYIAAKGKFFQQIIGLKDTSLNTITDFIKELHSLNLNWDTDELFFAQKLHESSLLKNVIFLKRGGWRPFASKRVDRANWQINKLKLAANFYIDAHSLRPLQQEYQKIKPLIDYIYCLSDGKRYAAFLLRQLYKKPLEAIKQLRQPAQNKLLFKIKEQFNTDSINRKIIAFSLYGNSLRYTQNIGEIITAYQTLMPEWKCRFYVSQDVLPETVATIIEHGGQVILMNATGIDSRYMFWRFMALDDTSAVIFRDLDSLPTYRELTMLKQWLNSDKALHVIRDHSQHSARIMGGMWGIKDLKLSFNNLIRNYTIKNDYGADQVFLEHIVYPQLQNNMLVHDSFPRFPNEDPIVIPLDAGEAYVGEITTDNQLKERDRKFWMPKVYYITDGAPQSR